MTLLDANILLFAYNANAPQQKAAAKWLVDLFKSDETIGLPWVTIWAFLRIATNPRVWTTPLSAQNAFAVVGDWIAEPGVILLHPGPRHVELLHRLVVTYGASGAKMTDAVLAALALENGGVLASADSNFGRFKEVRWLNPLAK